MAEQRKVKMKEDYRLRETLRDLFAGHEYTLDADRAKEVVSTEKGHYSNAPKPETKKEAK